MSRNRLGSVANAVRVLKSFTPNDPSWGVTDLAQRLDLSTSTVHRLLSTLNDEGMLEQDIESGRYRLGLAMFDLEAAVASQRGLHAAVLSPMTDLRNMTGETVQVGVLDGRQVVYVERLDSPNTVRVFARIGRRNDVHCTSSGKVLLAFSTKAARDRVLDGWEFPAQSEHTITDRAELERDLRNVRRRGYSTNREESELGVHSFAAPIRDESSRTVAAISVAGPKERLEANERAFAEAVVEIARRASVRMGWNPT